MRDPATFRKYAEECQRLARLMLAEHQAALLQIAEAWTQCAEEAEREAAKNNQ